MNFLQLDSYAQSLKDIFIVLTGLGIVGLFMSCVAAARSSNNTRPLSTKLRIIVKAVLVGAIIAATLSFGFSIILHKVLVELSSLLRGGISMVRQNQSGVLDAASQANLSVLLSGDIKSIVSTSSYVEKYATSYSVEVMIFEGIWFLVISALLVGILVSSLVHILCPVSWPKRWQYLSCGAVNTILWVGVGLHLVIAIVCADFCHIMETPIQFINEAGSKTSIFSVEEMSTYLGYFMFCNDSNPFEPFLMGAHSVINVVDKQFNESITTQTRPVDIQKLSASIQELKLLLAKIVDLLSCGYISHSIASIKNNICVSLLTTNVSLLCGLLVLSIIFGVGIIVCLMWEFCRNNNV